MKAGTAERSSLLVLAAVRTGREGLQTRRYEEAHRKALRHAYEEAGVSAVPMFVIGERVLTGLQDKETLEAAIDEALAASKRLPHGRGRA